MGVTPANPSPGNPPNMKTVIRRRDLFSVGAAGAFSLLILGSHLAAEEAITWSSFVSGLSIGIRLESDPPRGHLSIYLKNLGSTPLDLLVSYGEVQKIDFTATAPGGKEYMIRDRKLYRPCAGLCSLPVTERLNPGAIHKSAFALDDLLYVPAKGPYTSLGILLQRGYSVRAAFEVTSQQLKENSLSLEHAWLGRVVSGEVRVR